MSRRHLINLKSHRRLCGHHGEFSTSAGSLQDFTCRRSANATVTSSMAAVKVGSTTQTSRTHVLSSPMPVSSCPITAVCICIHHGRTCPARQLTHVLAAYQTHHLCSAPPAASQGCTISLLKSCANRDLTRTVLRWTDAMQSDLARACVGMLSQSHGFFMREGATSTDIWSPGGGAAFRLGTRRGGCIASMTGKELPGRKESSCNPVSATLAVWTCLQSGPAPSKSTSHSFSPLHNSDMTDGIHLVNRQQKKPAKGTRHDGTMAGSPMTSCR